MSDNKEHSLSNRVEKVGKDTSNIIVVFFKTLYDLIKYILKLIKNKMGK